ncbi:MAG TPA: hypothetical protein VES79_00775, partial [Solirubrobacteraceae bacterium]|nr:hypothetical protein [Solirubrobacteraceae bacterium]
MEAASVRADAIDRTEPRVAIKKEKRPKEGTPWWQWVAVAAIVLFCLFPFYWLINVSLRTG